ncbi:hypothetical protein jhhlp_001877 [Lomentospora prolificans]|uniref:LrgB-like protein n=1 Tax=Lomentospora prolificans TaxID=41688 RepID=A0A2N3NCK0_9PEZI|nr:hypothetical protein jhhlp_001877 [Lomentospora prolificans]
MAWRKIGLGYLSPITGMFVLFLIATGIQTACPRFDNIYHRKIRPRVDFVNQNLGIAFPIPIVVMSRADGITGATVGRIVASFLTTGLIFWVLALLLASALLAVVFRRPWRNEQWHASRGPDAPEPVQLHQLDANTAPRSLYRRDKESTGLSSDQVQIRTHVASSNETGEVTEISPTRTAQRSRRKHLRHWEGVILAVLCLVIIGLPVSDIVPDDRALDVCALWFAWALAVKIQYFLKRARLRSLPAGLLSFVATLANPVLVTAALMVGYTRLKAKTRGVALAEMLGTFSSGTALTEVWLRWSNKRPPDEGLGDWFGAGDVALSLLESGMVLWGFKLYEYRHELFSRMGALVIILSSVMAGLNAIISILLARAIGLPTLVTLAFAARCSTLALSRPSTTALGGNLVVNAGIVVGNGIVGQLMSPYILEWLRVPDNPTQAESRDADADDHGNADAGKTTGMHEAQQDSALDIAVGVAIGINGAAMGVSYLYERRSRVSPYAVLSMTAFGVATTLLCVFRQTNTFLQMLAHRDEE